MKDLRIMVAAVPAVALCSILLAGSCFALGKDANQGGINTPSKIIGTHRVLAAKTGKVAPQRCAKKRSPRAMTKSSTVSKKAVGATTSPSR